MRAWLFLLLALISTSAAAQQPSSISNMPYASTPFNGSELLYMVQSGVSKKTNLSTLTAILTPTGATITGNPSQNVTLLQNPYIESASLTNLFINTTPASATLPEFGEEITMNSSVGGVGTFKMPLFVSNTCNSPMLSGCYAINSVINLSAGFTTANNNVGFEQDCNNLTGDFGDTSGAPNYPVYYCALIGGGNGPGKLSAMLAIGSGYAQNRGLVFLPATYVLDTMEDFTTSQSTLRIDGTKTYGINAQGSTFSGAFALIPNNAAVAWLNAAGSSNLNLLILDTGNNFQIGNGAHEIYTTVPEYIESATAGTGLIVGNVTHAVGSIYGFGTGNDGGGLALYNGGTSLIQLVASGAFASYIDGFDNAQGLAIGSTTSCGAGSLCVVGTEKVAGLPTSAGSGGLYVCVDNTGAEYKKSSCP